MVFMQLGANNVVVERENLAEGFETSENCVWTMW